MEKSKFLYLNSRDELFRVDISKIVYFEANGGYTKFVLCNKLKGMVTMTLMQMQDLLGRNLKEQAANFARIGRRFIINLNYVFHIGVISQKLTLSDGENFAFQLPVSKEALKKLKEIYVAPGAKKG